jgi:hypothetical protein
MKVLDLDRRMRRTSRNGGRGTAGRDTVTEEGQQEEQQKADCPFFFSWLTTH